MSGRMKAGRFMEGGSGGYEPPVDVYETDSSFVCEVDLPGVRPEEFSIKVHEDILLIEGVRTEHPGQLKYLCMERNREGFKRLLRMPKSADLDSGRASYDNGVLTLVFPKKENMVVKIKIVKE